MVGDTVMLKPSLMQYDGCEKLDEDGVELYEG